MPTESHKDTLEFEQRYEKERVVLLLDRTRFLIIAGASVYFPFWLIDALTAPARAIDFLLLRLVFGSTLLLTLLALRARWAPRYSQALSAGWLVAVVVSICVMTSWLGGFTSTYYVGIMVTFFGAGMFMPWKWKGTFLFCASMIVAYFLINGLTRGFEPLVTAIQSSAFIAGTAILSCFASQAGEQSRRRDLRLRFQLEGANDELKAANAAKTRFLAAANHDLRQPLQALNWYLGGLRSQAQNAGMQFAVDKLQHSVDAMNQLFNGLLDVSRLDAGGVRPELSVLPLSDAFARLHLQYEPLAAAKSLDLIVTDTRSLVRADPLLLDQLLGNLVSNAVRHTVKGRIEVTARELVDKVCISVKDTGIGIPEEHLEDIFVEFFQVGNQERDRRKGLGLGLAIVKRLSDLLGYDVGVKSALGEGSEFHITVPLAQYVAEASPPRADTVAPTANDELQCIVAVVDDEPEIREALEFLLNQWGCLAITAASGHALFEALEGEDILPDVLVTDYRLPGGETGTELISRMSERAGEPLPAIMITGDTAPKRLREWQAKGLTVLHKPVSPERLRQALLLALSRDRKPT